MGNILYICLLDMDIRSYLQSGNLEQYCFELFNADLQTEVCSLSQAYSEIREELTSIEKSIEKLTAVAAVEAPVELRQKVLSAMGFPEILDIKNLPDTSRYSDYRSWITALGALIPDEPIDDFFMQVLRQDERITQTLVISKIDVPEEVHEDVSESFFILRGQCVCKVGDQEITLNPGDFLDIPLFVKHDVRLTSSHVVAILQHRL